MAEPGKGLKPSLESQAADRALPLIKEFEGFRSKAYYDKPGKTWTIGYGTTRYPTGQKVKAGDRHSVAECEAFLLTDIVKIRIPAIQKYVKVKLTSGELAALISFTYNLGNGTLQKSTLLKRLNRGDDKRGVASEFGKFVKAGGRTLRGLVRRREAEKNLFTA